MEPVIAILIAVFLSVFGQLFVKIGLNSIGLDFNSGIFSAYLKLFFAPAIIFGITSYTLSVFFWIYALSKVELSYAFPFLSLSYVLIMILSCAFLGEEIKIIRWLGIIIICVGVYLISKS